jgi:hypothetical protein
MEKMVNFPPPPPFRKIVVEFTLGKQKFPKTFPSKNLAGDDCILGKLDSKMDTYKKQEMRK